VVIEWKLTLEKVFDLKIIPYQLYLIICTDTVYAPIMQSDVRFYSSKLF